MIIRHILLAVAAATLGVSCTAPQDLTCDDLEARVIDASNGLILKISGVTEVPPDDGAIRQCRGTAVTRFGPDRGVTFWSYEDVEGDFFVQSQLDNPFEELAEEYLRSPFENSPAGGVVAPDETDAQRYQRWDIDAVGMGSTPYCMMTSEFQNGATLVIAFFLQSDTVSVYFTPDNARGLVDGELYGIKPVFVKDGGQTVEMAWGANSYEALGDPLTLTASHHDADLFLEDLRSNEFLGFMLEDTEQVLASFPLTGANGAVERLRECAISLAVR